MAVPTLYYFHSEGRAEPVRLTFALSNQELKQVRYTPEQWPEYKPQSPTGLCPWLQFEDGTKIGETIALVLYAAQKGGLLPTSEMGLGKAMEIIATIDSLITKFSAVRQMPDGEEKAAKIKEFGAGVLPDTFKLIEKLIAPTQSAEGYVVDNKLTIADVYVYQTYRGVVVNSPVPVKLSEAEVPKIMKTYNMVLERLNKINYYKASA